MHNQTSLLTKGSIAGLHGSRNKQGVPCPGIDVRILLPFFTFSNSYWWDLPGDVLAAPESALCGWEGVNFLLCV